jgi:hypothetical protein
VEAVIFRVPLLLAMSPPKPAALPLAMVFPEMETTLPLATVKMR